MLFISALYLLAGMGTLSYHWKDIVDAGNDRLLIIFVCLALFPVVWGAALVGDTEA